MSRDGQCRCGSVKVQTEGEPLAISMCHCRDCQRRTGSAFSIHAYFPSEKVLVKGTTRAHGRAADSGREVRFSFCPECGSTVFWEAALRPGAKGIPVGIFAEPNFPPPQNAIFTEHRHPWVVIPEGVPCRIGHGAPS
jgi:hypothetical protein